ncbi:hypothetical protein Nepgr_018306 [Nepenthes gracilis]|uniref:Uncharacterized protein n=1 Tax=Nepenthes gracilis TaxID=150966 RepID=A0AAD3ST35_NEPGR|nr:hypothetical protein Nepgr_018306 [Nepenthes gracilis]
MNGDMKSGVGIDGNEIGGWLQPTWPTGSNKSEDPGGDPSTQVVIHPADVDLPISPATVFSCRVRKE